MFLQSNPRNKRGHQDLLPIIFYHFVIKINYKIHLLVHVFHCLWNTCFHVLVFCFALWLYYFTFNCYWFWDMNKGGRMHVDVLLWPTLAICAWMPCDCKACTATSAAEGDSKSTNPYPANIQKKKMFTNAICLVLKTKHQNTKGKSLILQKIHKILMY